MRLQGKVAIVTGAGRGIGRATALALADEGAAVVLAARTVSEIESVAHEIGGQIHNLAEHWAALAALMQSADATTRPSSVWFTRRSPGRPGSRKVAC